VGRIDVTKIADGLYGIPVGPVNTFLLDSPDGCALIDTGVSGSTSAILRALHALGKQPYRHSCSRSLRWTASVLMAETRWSAVRSRYLYERYGTWLDDGI
jgi:hypothetical protein